MTMELRSRPCLLTVTTAGRMSTDEAAVRFLLQSTFGASRGDIRAFKEVHPLGAQTTIADTDMRLFQAWIDKQVTGF